MRFTDAHTSHFLIADVSLAVVSADVASSAGMMDVLTGWVVVTGGGVTGMDYAPHRQPPYTDLAHTFITANETSRLSLSLICSNSEIVFCFLLYITGTCISLQHTYMLTVDHCDVTYIRTLFTRVTYRSTYDFIGDK